MPEALTKADVRFERSHLVVRIPAQAGEAAILQIGDFLIKSKPLSGNDTEINFNAPYAAIVNQKELSYKITVIQKNGHLEDRKETLPEISLVNINSADEFVSLVQNPGTRQVFGNAARFCCKRALINHTDSSTIAAAICVLGYRVIEEMDAEDEDINLIKQHAVGYIKKRYKTKSEIRWSTSISMMLTYLSILIKDPLLTLESITNTLQYRTPDRLRTPNYSRSLILMAILMIFQKKRNEASSLLFEVESIFRKGVEGSQVEIPSRGYYPYTEIQASLNGVKAAISLKNKIENAPKNASPADIIGGFNIGLTSRMFQQLINSGYYEEWLKSIKTESDAQIFYRTECDAYIIEAKKLNTDLWETIRSPSARYDDSILDIFNNLTQKSYSLNDAMNPHWSGTAHLAQARFWLGVNLLKNKNNNIASSIFSAAAIWGKDLMSGAVFSSMEEVKSVNIVTSSIMIMYLIEHSIINPIDYYADKDVFVKAIIHQLHPTFNRTTDQYKLARAIVENLSNGKAA